MTEFENNQVESGNESMEAALDNFQEVKVGDIVKGEVLALRINKRS